MDPHTRLFYVADLHGSEPCFRKFVNAASVYRANVLIVGGDISAKTLSPVFKEEGMWTATVSGQPFHARSLTELERLESALRGEATVPLRTTRPEWERILEDRGEADRVFERRALEELARWLAWARARLRDRSVRLLIGLGNDDLDSMEELIVADERAELTDREILAIDDRHELITLPYSNPTPWKTRRELSEEEIGRRLDQMRSKLRRPERAVFNLHAPPHGTALDLAPRLDANLTKVMSPGGDAELVHVGSRAVREAIDRFQPLLGLHGHIHESRGFATLGRTLCLNPGSAYSEGTLLGAVVDLDEDRVKSYVLTSG